MVTQNLQLADYFHDLSGWPPLTGRTVLKLLHREKVLREKRMSSFQKLRERWQPWAGLRKRL